MLRNAIIHKFISHDGATLSYRHWPSASQASATQTSNGQTNQAIILFHRGHEHSARLQDIVDQLDMPNVHIFAWDARGHGLSEGVRGYAKHFGVLVKDADCFAQHLCSAYALKPENIAVVAQSVGAVIAATWLHDYAPNIRAIVLVSPALRVRLYVPLAIPSLRLLIKIKPIAFIKSYVKGKLLTHNPAKAASYNSDPLVSPIIAVNILVGLHDAATRLMDDAAAIQTPMQLLVSGADWVVAQAPQHHLFERWGASLKEKHVYPSFLHDTLNEQDNHLPIAALKAFIAARFAAPVAIANMQGADQAGYTYNEYVALAKPLPSYHPQAWYYGFFRRYLRSVGKLSQGMRIGVATGFDSGASLDYVYQNQARGVGAVGRAMDTIYLNSIGWRGIRVRKQHLVQLLASAVNLLSVAGQPVRLLDIAAGHGRYIVDALSKLQGVPFSAHLRDYDAQNVAAGQALIEANQLQNHITFVQGDAFDTSSLAAITPQATIGVVSGLYELYADNAAIKRSLVGMAGAVQQGGYLIYTNQPWHPQLALIARGLSSHRSGKPWVMRRRTQLEIDQLVAAAGFCKVEMLIDEWGIFTVSLAKRL